MVSVDIEEVVTISGAAQTVVTINGTSTCSFSVILQVKFSMEPAIVVLEGDVITTEVGAGTDG